MSIQQSEIKWYKSADMSSGSSGGGRMTTTSVTSGTKNNAWPDVTQAERDAGDVQYRKLFLKIDNPDDLALQLSKIFVENYTPAEDAIVIFPGTQNDIKSELTGSERNYGCGSLTTTVLAAVTEIEVTTEGVLYGIFQDGDTIRISDKADVDASGNEEYALISGAPSYSGNVATITLDAGLVSGYSSTDTRVSSVIETFVSIAGSSGATVVTRVGSSDGDYDEATNPITVPSISGIDQTWTLTINDTLTGFSITGNTLGLLGTGGSTTSDTSPVNPDFGTPYFTIYTAGFSGSFEEGDVIVFDTSPASAPIWQMRDVPLGANSLTDNGVIIAVDGSSE